MSDAQHEGSQSSNLAILDPTLTNAAWWVQHLREYSREGEQDRDVAKLIEELARQVIAERLRGDIIAYTIAQLNRSQDEVAALTSELRTERLRIDDLLRVVEAAEALLKAYDDDGSFEKIPNAWDGLRAALAAGRN